MRILLVDNYDSFTFNLAQLLSEAGMPAPTVVGRDEVKMYKVKEYDRILFSPGPGLPDESPVMHEILDRFGKEKPILGVCLGHQAIATFFGGKLFRQESVIHGIRKEIKCVESNCSLFQGLPLPFQVGLYHSWGVVADTIPGELQVTAWSSDGLVMAMEHRFLPITGIQFHPESFMTSAGATIVTNWLNN